ncbi:phospho-N-acetylmuramoyl-pentapeptide-transferase [Exiguobacterium sp. s193]|uniref:phospho-N-acetylmuramoyl-pentapeptide- transferase n=1 Tax=Exiguobacterium sp. s193 TaxID=2751207 RepID=UPI001BE4EE74|nr:phospho-N-acetylmuramoyl-pentapeptide-transferase [Exiguobacterium sp. s193]
MITLFISLIIALLVVILVMPQAIPFLHRLKFGQEIREEGPEWHQVKSGTPTMGGIVILLAMIGSLIAAMITGDLESNHLSLLFLTLAYGAIGFIDDYIKVVKKRNLGLNSKQKLIGQIVVGLLFIWLSGGFTSEATYLSIPFTSLTVDFGLIYPLVALFWLVGFSNAVNLTDGLDGLVSFTAIPTFLFFSLYAWYVADEVGVALFAMSAVGALIGFLLFNAHPAKIFMGDTGSLALGAALAGLSILLKLELLLVLIGIVFVVETLSVILQVLSFKTTGKRIFKMSPIHHHFEMIGWSEWRIVGTFASISCIMAFVAYLFV